MTILRFLTPLAALTLLASTALPAQDPAPDLGTMTVTETRANTCTFSAQEDPSVAVDEAGRILVVWSSRRQERGTYGVFAQLLDPLGRPLGTELHVNRTQLGTQQDAQVVFGPAGAAWVAWSSMDLRTENNGIFLRRLADGDDGFAPRGDEVRVAIGLDGLLTDPAVAVSGEGELLVTWVENVGDAIRVRGRRLDADGAPRGEGFALGTTPHGTERLPDTVALPDGRFFAVWQRADAAARPLGIFGRFLGADGPEGQELVLHDVPERMHVEPRLAVDAAGELVAVWMAAAEGTADYEVRARRFAADGSPRGASFVVEAGGEGRRNGATVTAGPGGRLLVAYNDQRGAYLTAEGRHAVHTELRARLFDAAGNPLGPGYRVSASEPGHYAMQVAANARPVVWSEAGPLVFTWGGTSPGDGGGVGVRILTPPGFTAPPPAPVVPVAACGELTAADFEAGPRPDPLPEWRLQQRPVPDTDVRADGFVAHDQTGWIPPDPDLAVGPDRIVSQANQETACFDKNGVVQWRRANTGASGFWAAQGAETFVFDPICVFDPHSNRFVIANSELASDGDYVVLAVSKDASPDDVNDWWKYRVQVSPTCGFPDFPNLGVNRDYIYVTTDCFGGGGSRVVVFDKAAVTTGSLGTWWNEQMAGWLQSLSSCKNYDTANAFQYFVSGGTSKSLRIQCKQSPAAPVDTTTVAVAGWGPPPGAPQQGSSNLLSTIDTRTKNAVVRNGRLYVAHGVGYRGETTTVKWYEIDLAGWPASGNQPVVLQDARLDLGSGVFSWFPDIHADAAGNITVAYNRSAANELPSIEACFRRVGDAPGTMRPPKRIKTSSTPYTANRYGDYSGVDQDPVQPERFWSHAEYSRGPWETWIGYWDVNDEPDPYAQFLADGTEGDEDLLVTFTDWSLGTGLSFWSWDFGDGTTSDVQHPTHLYVDPGTYTVSLLVGGSSGFDLRTKHDLVIVDNVPEARATIRNGSGLNPVIFTSTSLPYLGTTWTTEIDGGAIGGAGLTFVVGYTAPISGIVLHFGELLLDPSSAWILTSLSFGGAGISSHSVPVPNDPSLAGFMFSTQGFLNNVAGSGSGRLTNAIDLELSY